MFTGMRDFPLNTIIITIVLIVSIIVLGSVGIVKVTKQYKSLTAKILLYFMLGCAIISGLFVIFIMVGRYYRVI